MSPVAADHLSGEVAANFLAHGTTSSEQTVTSRSEWLLKRPYVLAMIMRISKISGAYPCTTSRLMMRTKFPLRR